MARNFLHLTKEGERYMREIRELESSCVKVGFQAGVDPYEDGTQLPDVAAYNEFGGSTRPARPFMKQSFANNEDKLQAACNRAQRIIYDGGTAEDALKKLGVALKGIVQNEIREGEFYQTNSFLAPFFFNYFKFLLKRWLIFLFP